MADARNHNRRDFLKNTLATTAVGAGLLTTGWANAKTVGINSSFNLDQAKWAPKNRGLLNELIARYGKSAKNYNPQRRPYAVFDWDNTCIMNDCEEALLMYQINHLAFKLSPDEFSKMTRQNVPQGAFNNDYKNKAGNTVGLESICSDLDTDYRFLYDHFKGMAGTQSIEAIRETPQFLDFRAKLYFLYDAVNGTHGVHVGYPWVIYFLSNMTLEELKTLVESSNDVNLGMALNKTTYTSPEKLAGKAGVVNIGHFHGMRLCTEIATLMDAFQQNGIDTYVCTASLEEVVAVFATYPKYGYHVKRDHVIGLRLQQANGRLTNTYLPNWPLTWGPGKTEVIRRELVAKKGYGPIFVAGDSDGDYDMLRDFSDTQLGLIVNRLKTGKIGELSKLAADSIASASPRFILQGRQESTGNWLPSASSLKYGKNSEQLVAS